jgi:hypothetical protein
MKSFTRACLIFSGVVIAIGLVLTIIGGCLGAGSAFAKMVGNGAFSFNWDSDHSTIDIKDLTDVNEEFTDIKKLDIDLKYGSLKVEKTDGNTCKVVAESVVKGFSCKEKDGTLIIEDNISNAINFGFDDDYDPTITLYIPQGSSYEDVDIDVGAGYVNASDINTKDLSIDIGAGEFEGNKINAKDAKLSVGAGHLLIEEFVTDTVKLDCGTGKMEVYGNVQSDSNIDCGIGDIVLSVANAESSYDYDIDCGIGNVSVGDNSFGGIATEKTIDNNSGNEMKIDCGVGNVEVIFNETI